VVDSLGKLPERNDVESGYARMMTSNTTRNSNGSEGRTATRVAMGVCLVGNGNRVSPFAKGRSLDPGPWALHWTPRILSGTEPHFV
jgi:hypothetical protein